MGCPPPNIDDSWPLAFPQQQRCGPGLFFHGFAPRTVRGQSGVGAVWRSVRSKPAACTARFAFRVQGAGSLRPTAKSTAPRPQDGRGRLAIRFAFARPTANHPTPAQVALSVSRRVAGDEPVRGRPASAAAVILSASVASGRPQSGNVFARARGRKDHRDLADTGQPTAGRPPRDKRAQVNTHQGLIRPEAGS